MFGYFGIDGFTLKTDAKVGAICSDVKHIIFIPVRIESFWFDFGLEAVFVESI